MYELNVSRKNPIVNFVYELDERYDCGTCDPANRYRGREDDICWFTRRFIAYFLLTFVLGFLLSLVVFGMIFNPLFALIHWTIPVTVESTMDIFVVLGYFGYGAAVVMPTTFYICHLIDKAKEGTGEPGVVREMYRSFKDRVCFKIRVNH